MAELQRNPHVQDVSSKQWAQEGFKNTKFTMHHSLTIYMQELPFLSIPKPMNTSLEVQSCTTALAHVW
jgi:hypothetical protein